MVVVNDSSVTGSKVVVVVATRLGGRAVDTFRIVGLLVVVEVICLFFLLRMGATTTICAGPFAALRR